MDTLAYFGVSSFFSPAAQYDGFTWWIDFLMTFKLWLRTLLCYAAAQKRTRLVARIGPRLLKRLYLLGVAPSVESIVAHRKWKAAHRKKKTRMQNCMADHQNG
jgi:hypothetical protein